MSIPLGTFDPAALTIVLNGVPLVAPAKGTFCKISRDSDAYTDDVGGRGDVVRIKSNDNRGKVDYTAMQNSPDNDTLNALAQLDEISGTGITTLEVRDHTGTTVGQCPNCWVMKKADSEFATEHTPRQWTIRVPNLNYTVGASGTVAV